MNRRNFLQTTAIFLGGNLLPRVRSQNDFVMTVTGKIPASSLGITLVHEHILVDFIGAQEYDPHRWDDEEVYNKVLPYLKELKTLGCNTLVDCTPAYLGRDVQLLKKLSSVSGIKIITNTGYYGGSAHKFLPPQVFNESPAQLSERWIEEFRQGIEHSGIYPGFIKISVNNSNLSEVSGKLIRAAGLTHLKTGLTIASHTGPGVPALEQLEILKEVRVSPSAFIWVHAQAEKDWSYFKKAADLGAWVSLDGLSEEKVNDYLQMLLYLKNEKCLHRALISHDAGWYEPGKPGGGTFRGYTVLFTKLLPLLKEKGFTEGEISQLIRINPANALSIKTRAIS